MEINTLRLKKRMDEINQIAVTQEGGMNRLALTDADKKARDLLVKWMKEAQMEVKVDDMGSIYGYTGCLEKEALPVCMGSHADTQPNGGKYDGFFGVMAALEVACTLKDHNVFTKRPLVVIDWTNEEGARFVPPMLASGVVAGKFEGDWVHCRLDSEGKSYLEELKRIGYLGSKENRLKKAAAYVEAHIEQGPILDAQDDEIGIVTGALGIVGLDVTVQGEANHAGTTPMSHRKDALMAAAEAMLKIKAIVGAYGDPAVITIGIIQAKPATKNIIPGEVYFSIDMRHEEDGKLIEMETEIRTEIQKVCSEYGTQVKIERYWKADPTAFQKDVVNAVEDAAFRLGAKAKKMISGAGHDAVFISEIIPTGMIFVPSVEGKSHCPQEETKWEDMVKGTQVLLETVLTLADK